MFQNPDSRDFGLSDGHFDLDRSTVSLRASYVYSIFPGDIVVKWYLCNGSDRTLLLRRGFIFHLFSCQRVLNCAQDSPGTVGGAGDYIHIPCLRLNDPVDNAFRFRQELCGLSRCTQNINFGNPALFYSHLYSNFPSVTAGRAGVNAVLIGISGILLLLLLFFLRIRQSRFFLCSIYFCHDKTFRKLF